MNNETHSGSHLNELVRRAEIQQANMVLNAQFRKNMDFFKHRAPEIYERFNDYDPQKLRLLYSEEGYINLVNYNLNNRPVYNDNPQDFCRNYVNQYIKEPTFYRISAKTTEVIDEENDAHVSKMNALIRFVNGKEQLILGQKIQPHTNFMIMLGLGLGFQLEYLLENTDIHHLVIIEPHEDIFYASLHTIEWEALYDYFAQNDHTMTFIVGRSPGDTFDEVRKYLHAIGIHNCTKPFVYDHLSSPEMKDTTKLFFDHLPSMIATLGYFDDEQISLSHSVANYRSGLPILREHALINKKHQILPAVVIGNGPSLDDAKDFLFENQDKMIIISCGTAIGSLKKLGIKPDFHVEMERTRPVIEWLDMGTDPEYRKDITLLALNTVHPEVFDRFDTAGIGMKSNDLGTHFLCQYIGADEYIVNMSLSNPTVANTGMAFASALGFKTIYMVGTDFGFSEGTQHHSSLSAHYDIKEEHEEDLHLYKADAQGNIELPGNFGGKVKATVIYNHARQSVESLLRMNPHIDCFNTSRGLAIAGAKPIRYKDIELKAFKGDKHELAKDIFKKNFYNKGLKKIHSKKEVFAQFSQSREVVEQLKALFAIEPRSRNDAHSLLNRQHVIAKKLAENQSTQYIYSLFKGSFNAFSLVLTKTLYASTNEEECLSLFNEGKQYYIDFLDHALRKIETELLAEDTRSRDLANKKKS
ncbi:motility associated factor glycosyltransferase family protein [Aurantivibrio plasticivorans]